MYRKTTEIKESVIVKARCKIKVTGKEIINSLNLADCEKFDFEGHYKHV